VLRNDLIRLHEICLVKHVETLSSKKATEVFKLFQEVNPTLVHTIQTDNGSEFLKTFHTYLEKTQIRHQFIYPHMSKVNSYIERFNRIIQEEFILRNDEIFYDQKAFAKELTKYLYWYNYQRPHASLKYVSPMTFIQTQSSKSA